MTYATSTDIQSLFADMAASVQFIAAADAPAQYLQDWSGHFGEPADVLRPRTPEAVAEVMKRLHRAGLRMVVQGGMTGLVGSGAPVGGEVVLSVDLLNQVEGCDPLCSTLTVQAGVPLEVVQKTAELHGLFFPVDLGSRGSCHIGGNISTNAGGNRVLQYGMTRNSVLGLEVVLPDGSVFSHMHGVLKDNTGYDLKQLFIGAEGTLGIVTRAVLRLQPLPRSRHTAVLGLHSLGDVLKALMACRAHFGPMLTSFEVMWRDYIDFVTGDLKTGRDPFAGECSHVVLIEVSGFDSDSARAEARVLEALSDIAGALQTEHVIVAQSLAEASALWRVRESSGEAARGLGDYLSFDISIPSSRLETCLASIYGGLRALDPALRSLTYGHLGDGNVHLLVGCKPPELRRRVEEMVYALASGAGGSISAEHGIGFEKRERFEALCPPVELDAMRRIKHLFDPGWLLNRGRVFTPPDETTHDRT